MNLKLHLFIVLTIVSVSLACQENEENPDFMVFRESCLLLEQEDSIELEYLFNTGVVTSTVVEQSSNILTYDGTKLLEISSKVFGESCSYSDGEKQNCRKYSSDYFYDISYEGNIITVEKSDEDLTYQLILDDQKVLSLTRYSENKFSTIKDELLYFYQDGQIIEMKRYNTVDSIHTTTPYDRMDSISYIFDWNVADVEIMSLYYAEGELHTYSYSFELENSLNPYYNTLYAMIKFSDTPWYYFSEYNFDFEDEAIFGVSGYPKEITSYSENEIFRANRKTKIKYNCN